MAIQLLVLVVLLGTPLSSFASMSAPLNYHPAFKILSHAQLAEIEPAFEYRVALSNLADSPLVEQLHFDEVEPAEKVSLADTASFDLSLLVLSNNRSLGSSETDILSPNPVIKVNDQNYTLSIVQSIFDERQNVRYVTAKVAHHKGYGRFIIDNRSSELAAVLVIDGNRYRILTRAANSAQQLIYRMPALTPEELDFPRPLMVSKETHSSVYRLEEELLKTELLLKMAPSYYHQSSRELVQYMTVEHGKIAVINTSKLKVGIISEEIREVLSRIELLTGAEVNDDFVITKLTRNKKERITDIIFQQIVDGALFDEKSTIHIHRDGHVSNLTLRFINTKHSDFHRPVYDLEQALKLAEKMLLTQDLDSLPIYKEEPFAPYKMWMTHHRSHKLLFLWFLVVSNHGSSGQAYVALVDGFTGHGVTVMKYAPRPAEL